MKVADVRLKVVWLICSVMLVAIAWFAPTALQSLALAIAKVTSGAILGYWCDRGMFPYARPSASSPFVQWMFRRAAIVAACALAVALAV